MKTKIGKERNRGITLIALIVTIIVLIILAGITINLLFADNGIINKAKQSAKAYGDETDKETLSLMYTSYLIETIPQNSNKTFMEYLEENGYDVESTDVDGKQGTIIMGTKKYTVDVTSGKVNIEYIGEATKEELNKPKFTSAEAVVDGNSATINVSLKNGEGTSITYSIKKENDSVEGAEQASNIFNNLQANTNYIVTIKATSTDNQTTIKIIRVKTLSLAELTYGKASFSINPNTKWQKEVTATITNTYTLGANEVIKYRIGSEGEFTTYTEPFVVRDNVSLYGIFYNTETEEVGDAFTFSGIDVIDKEAPVITVTEVSKGSNKIKVNVTAVDGKIGMPESLKYTYYISTDSTNYGNAVKTEITDNPYEFTGLTPNTTYYIKVTSKDKAGNEGEGKVTIKTDDFVYVSIINLSDTSKTIGLSTATISVTSVESTRAGVEATESGVTWSTSDSSKVSIESQTDSEVTIMGRADTGGTPVTITATAKDGSGITATCSVEVFNGTLISTRTQLEAIANNLSGNYKLANDIDLEGVAYSTSVIEGVFVGTLDGCGHTIRNINISKSSTSEGCGLFTYGVNCTIKNLNMENLYYTSNAWAAPIIGCTGSGDSNILIMNCNISNAYIQAGGGQYAGGLIGCLWNSSQVLLVKDCSVKAQLVGRYDSNEPLCGEKYRPGDYRIENSSFEFVNYQAPSN